MSWSADPDSTLRTLVIDCVAICLSIGARHRSTLPDNNLNQDLSETKKIIVNEDAKILFEGVTVFELWLLVLGRYLDYYD